ncbi:hypothetical protein JHW43_006166 [Diplocarpon mali]|nr:hypothetical protein JHW43_006166 [Diplocarpon mali]
MIRRCYTAPSSAPGMRQHGTSPQQPLNSARTTPWREGCWARRPGTTPTSVRAEINAKTWDEQTTLCGAWRRKESRTAELGRGVMDDIRRCATILSYIMLYHTSREMRTTARHRHRHQVLSTGLCLCPLEPDNTSRRVP